MPLGDPASVDLSNLRVLTVPGDGLLTVCPELVEAQAAFQQEVEQNAAAGSTFGNDGAVGVDVHISGGTTGTTAAAHGVTCSTEQLGEGRAQHVCVPTRDEIHVAKV